jgi:hypothetical protein
MTSQTTSSPAAHGWGSDMDTTAAIDPSDRGSNVAAPTTTGGRRWLPAGLAATTLLLISIGLSGIGDAPDPHASPNEIADWFTVRRTDILRAAPFGYLGALAIVALAVVLAAPRQRATTTMSSRVLIAGGIITATYLFSVHLGWSANAYLIAESTPQSAKAVFVTTITSVPMFALGVGLMAGAAAVHAPSPVVGRWWRIASAAVAALSSVGMIAIADRGYFSPDVQQQTIGNILLAWLLITTVVAALPTRPTPPGTSIRAPQGTDMNTATTKTNPTSPTI